MKIGKLPYIKTVMKIASIYKTETLFSFIFTVILASGYLLSTYDTIDVVPVGKGVLLADVFGALVIWCVIFLSLTLIKGWCLRRPGTPTAAVYLKNIPDNKLWLLTSLAIFACYLPIILASLSMLSPDSWSSIRQVVGVAPLNNANPLIFTAFVGIFISLGRLFAGIELGTVLFSLAQSAILAVIFARVIVWMRREKVSRGGIIATFIFFAILPINSIAGIIMWKDILFAGFGLIFLLLLRQLYVEGAAFFSVKKVSYYIIFAFLFCTWRNNGLYAYELFVILAIITNGKTFFDKRYLLLLFFPIILTLIYLHIVKLPTSHSEIVSVPLQQIARTVKYESSSISTGDKKIINEILPYDQLGDKYNPRLSDPVKSSLNEKAFDKHEGRYFSVWLRLLGGHKKTYVASFLYNNYGYMYPFYLSSTPTDILLDNANHPNAIKGYTDTAYTDGGKLMVINYRDFVMRTVPILHNIGLYSCVILLASYIAIIRKRRELIGVFIILVSLFISTILGPVNGEFRYLYLFVVAIPFVGASVFSNYSPMKSKAKHV